MTTQKARQPFSLVVVVVAIVVVVVVPIVVVTSDEDVAIQENAVSKYSNPRVNMMNKKFSMFWIDENESEISKIGCGRKGSKHINQKDFRTG